MFQIIRRSIVNQNPQTKFLVRTFCSLDLSSCCSEPRTSDRLRSFLTSYGFSKAQISKIIRVSPDICWLNPYKTLDPKIQFLLSTGISKAHLPRVITNNYPLLKSSLENQLIPCHNYLKGFLIEDRNVARMLMTNSRILLYDLENRIVPNINLLTEIGVPKSLISFILINYPSVVCAKATEVKRSVEEAIQMGFDPRKTIFGNALKVFVDTSKTAWNRNWKVYRSWGLSDDEIGIAFRVHPLSMSLSEEKITKGMEIFVNEMGREPAEVARSSVILFYSLENRIKPRCKVIKLLISNGLLKKNIALGSFLMKTEAQFLDRYVSKYEDRVPELLKIYQTREIV